MTGEGDGAFSGTAGNLQYSPSAAASLISACFDLAGGLQGGMRTIRSLTRVAASGNFPSGKAVDERLGNVGKIAFEAIDRMVKDADDAKEAAKQAGLKFVDQDERTRDHLRRALEAWKLSPMDLASLDKGDNYTAAREEMFSATDTDFAPWTVVKSNDKKRARVNAMRHVLSLFDYDGKDESIVATPDPLIVGRAKSLIGE